MTDATHLTAECVADAQSKRVLPLPLSTTQELKAITDSTHFAAESVTAALVREATRDLVPEEKALT